MPSKYCPHCEETKDISAFHNNRSSKDGLAHWCKQCNKEYRVAHPNIEYIKAYRARNPERKAKWSKDFYEKNSKKIKEETKQIHVTRKIKVLVHYGRGRLACVKCGFGDIRALSIDHIEGGGTNHRKTIGKGGSNFYGWLERNGYPEGYQTLCMNCQYIKRVENKEYLKREDK